MKIIAPVFLVGFLLLSATSGSGTRYWHIDCYTSTGSYTAQSIYGKNIKFLFASLPKKVSSSPALFARDAVGSSANETAYAVAQCQRDADASVCNICVTEALEDAQAVCAFKKSAIVYHDLCTVRFSNTTLSWRSDAENFQDTIAVKVDSSDITKQKLQTTQLEMGVNTLSTAVTKMAANTSDSFATASEKIDASGTSYEAYALAQCVGEMTHAECGMCLEDLGITYSLAGLVHRKATTWCSYRFDFYIFFTGSPMVRLPPYSAHKGHRIKKKTIVILVVVGVLVLLLAVLTVFFFWRKQKKGSVAGEARNRKIETVEGGFSEKHRDTSEEDILSAEKSVKCPSALMCFSEITAMAHGKNILLFLDYDGTVSPINDYPFEATMPPEIREAVQKAAELFPTSIVSGRLIAKLKNFIKLDNLNYAGSHGQEIVMRGELEPSYTPVGNYEQPVTAATHYLEEGSREIEGAMVENNKYAVTMHYRNLDEKDWPLIQKLVEDAKDAFEGLEITRGHMVLELRAQTGLNKGTAVNYLINYILGKLGLDISEVLPIYFGDDVTDEDAFEVLHEKKLGFGVLISLEPRTSKASYSLKDPFEVGRFLTELVEWRESLEALSATVENSNEIVETSSRSSRLPR